MPSLSFRAKLLASVMVVVVCVAGATLVVTEREVQAAYEKIFKEKLEDQITYLPREQEARLSAVREKCLGLVQNVRFVAALQSGDPELLYKVARDDLQTVMRANSGSVLTDAAVSAPATRRAGARLPRAKGALLEAAAQRGRAANFLAFLDAEGHLIEDPNWKLATEALRQRMRQRMEQLARSILSMSGQQVGYVTIETMAQKAMVLEIIVTPILDVATGQNSGALVLGFPFNDGGEQSISDVSDIENGVWVDNQLFSQTIPAPALAELARRLPEEIQRHPVPRENFLLAVAGVPHRVFYTPLNPGSPLPTAHKVGLYSWAGALQAREELRAQILLFSSGALIAGVFLCLLLAHGFSVPINALAAGTAEIQRGNFAVKIPVRSRDEIGRLTESFNQMAADLALKERYHNLLNMVTDKDVAQELISGKFALGGERREASVIFCDIRGFTPLTQGMDPAEVIQMLNEHMTALASVVNEHHGIVDKFIGDCVMAVFGAPKSYGNDAENAARCALKMVAERRRLNEISRYKIDIGIGVASGPLVAGNMGSKNRLNYTVLGENVNLASRLCGVAGRMEVVISAATLASLGERAEITPVPELKLKGFTGGISAAKLFAVKPA